MSAPEGLAHLFTEDADDIASRFHNYQKRAIVKGRFIMTSIQVKRLKALMYWVQDCNICQDNYDFPDVINQLYFLIDVDESLQPHVTKEEGCRYRQTDE